MSRHRKPHGVFDYEHKTEPLLPYPAFLRRLARSVALGTVFVVGALVVGVVGYKVTSGGAYSWSDAFYNASMILGGMGPVDDRGLRIPEAEKWFASFYALFSGVAFLIIVGVMFAPLYHRLLHHFHLEMEEDGHEEG
jgi:hypothetical protein